MDNFQNKRRGIVDNLYGFKISDPFRWLEDSVSPETKEWVDEQNSRTEKKLKIGSFDIFSRELADNFKVVNFSEPVPVKGKYFYTERQPDEDQPVLYIKDGLDGVPVKLFDPNGKREGNTVTIDYWNESHTGKYVSYGISEGGNEMATLYVKDTDTGEELPDRIVHCRYSSVRWLPDDSAFFYTRNPRPGTVSKDEEHLHTKVYLHRIGDNPDDDEFIFGGGRPKDDMIGIGLSPDGKLLAIHVSNNWTENEVYIYDRDTRTIKPIVTGIPSKFSVFFLPDRVLMMTNHEADNYRVLWTGYDELYRPVDEWDEFIPEKEFLLEFLKVVKGKVLAGYLINASSKVFVFDYEGNEIGKIPLPNHSSLAGISGRREEEEFFYGISSFLFPKISYRYDPKSSEYSEYRRTDNPINPDSYEVVQKWCSSKDGTNVPVFIVTKKGITLDGSNPTILYGYGGFGVNETPSFLKNWLSWLERGGVFAVANIRGGGEFGSEWHKDGIKENKQKSFDDFISVAECLVSEEYTNNKHLGILGGSNGGLLVSAVGIQRPNLFKAVCSRVPLTDMVRFHKFGIAGRWTHEFGNPDIKSDLKSIFTWSPYHNVKKGVGYPKFLFTTAESDTRVEPFHAWKMAARLQEVGNKESFVFTEKDAGHGAGKPVAKLVEVQAMILSFFATELNLEI